MSIATRYSNRLDRATSQSRKRLQESRAIGNRAALDELGEVFQECSEAGWDGYNARPVDQEKMLCAFRIIDSLPPGFPMPSIGADPDGQIALDWRTGPHRILSVSVDPEGVLHYAGIYGRNKHHGTIEYYFSAPDKLLQLVAEL